MSFNYIRCCNKQFKQVIFINFFQIPSCLGLLLYHLDFKNLRPGAFNLARMGFYAGSLGLGLVSGATMKE